MVYLKNKKMHSSEIVFKKKPNLLTQFLNILNTFLIKHGKKKSNFFVVMSFLFNLKLETAKKFNLNSSFYKFYNLLSKFTPRVNVVYVENKKAGKVFKTPMPPLKNSLLQHNFLIKFLNSVKTSKFEYKNYSTQFVRNYTDLFEKGKGELAKELNESYEILKQHKFRAKKRHDKMIKIKKVTAKNAIKKSKQFYI